MRIRFAEKKLARLETELTFTAGFGPNIINAFRRILPVLRNALDERDCYAMKSLHYEKLKGNRSHQRSMRLNKQFRLIIEFEQASNIKTVVVINIEDYH